MIIDEDERGLTARLSVTNQDLAAGAIALCRGVSEVIMSKLLAIRVGWAR